MARERTMRFRRSYLRYGAANAAKCGAATPERLWQSQRPSYETRLRNKGGHRSPCPNVRGPLQEGDAGTWVRGRGVHGGEHVTTLYL